MKRFWLVAAVAALAVLTAALGGSTAYGGSSAAAPVKVGVLTSLTANFAPWGIQFRAGAALAVNEINRKGGVKGRLLNLAVADDQSIPNGGIDGFRKLTQEDKVVSVGGVVGSNVGLATARLAEQAEVPLFLLRAGDDTILTTKSRYTFRTCLPPAQEDAPPILELAQARGVKSVGAIVADYAWGQAFKKALQDTFDGVSGIKLNTPMVATRYTNRMSPDPATMTIKVRQVKGDLDGSSYQWKVVPLGEGRSRIFYSGLVKNYSSIAERFEDEQQTLSIGINVVSLMAASKAVKSRAEQLQKQAAVTAPAPAPATP